MTHDGDTQIQLFQFTARVAGRSRECYANNNEQRYKPDHMHGQYEHEINTDSGSGNQGVRDLKTTVHGHKYFTVVLKLFPQKLHNELKSQINRTILALERINAPPSNQRAA
jgi:hypothetical protein